MRIVSLVPSATETLLAFGITPVAVTRFCEHPELPQVGGTKNPDVAAIVALAPDLVVLCEEENRKDDAEALNAAGLVTATLVIESVADAVFATQVLAGFAGIEAAPAELVALAPARRLRAFVPIWRRPWMTMNAATYGSSLLEYLGVDNVFADAGDRYPEVTLDEVRARRPDIVLAPSEPYSFKPEHLAELASVAPVERVDGQDLFWWGARTPVALDRLAAALAAHLATP